MSRFGSPHVYWTIKGRYKKLSSHFHESSWCSCVSPTPSVVSCDPILLLKCINKPNFFSFMHLFIWGYRSWEIRALIYALLLHYLSKMKNQKLSLLSKRLTNTLQDFIIWWKICKFLQYFIIQLNISQDFTISYSLVKYSPRFYKIL